MKNKLFSTYFSNIYLCAVWVNCKKIMRMKFSVASNNAYRILNKLPMRCSAMACLLKLQYSKMYNTYSIKCTVESSLNAILPNLVMSDLYCLSSARRQWTELLYSI